MLLPNGRPGSNCVTNRGQTAGGTHLHAVDELLEHGASLFVGPLDRR